MSNSKSISDSYCKLITITNGNSQAYYLRDPKSGLLTSVQIKKGIINGEERDQNSRNASMDIENSSECFTKDLETENLQVQSKKGVINAEMAQDSDECEEIGEQPRPLSHTGNKHEWQYIEVKNFIASYQQHKDEFTHPKKRKYVWENICNDLISNGCNVTPIMCKNKWKNLVRTYKTCKDAKKRTGNAPT